MAERTGFSAANQVDREESWRIETETARRHCTAATEMPVYPSIARQCVEPKQEGVETGRVLI